MGRVVDRTKEHLVATDVAIVRLRRLLLETARDLAEGIEPPVLQADLSTVQSADGLVAAGSSWRDLVPGNRPTAGRASTPKAV
jgi:phthalate 4,5-dioxygenase oxygenase subunit